MRIKFIVVGKLSLNSRNLFDFYLKRIRHYAQVSVSEIKEITGNNTEIIKQKETFLINKVIPKNALVYLCSLQGKEYTSEQFSELLNVANIVFIIGGSNGLIESGFENKIKFSNMTFPHQLFRIILAEQIFRGFNIKNNGKYHK